MTRLIRVLACVLLLSPVCGFGQGVTLPVAERIVLDNGVVLILNEKRDVPLVAIDILIRGGAVADPEGKEGVASLLTSLLEKGAGDRDAQQFAEAVAAVGGRVGSAAGLEAINIWGDFLSRHAELMVELFADMLLRPALDADEFEKLRDRQVNYILAAKDSDPGNLMPIYASAWLFGDHPYGTSSEGSEASLADIRHRDVVEYYEQQVGADRLIVAVSGDFDIADMRTLLADTFGGWRAAGGELQAVTAPEPQTGRRVLLIDKPEATQTYFWIGNVGVAKNYERRADLDLANTVFGGRFTSMLNDALRVESGLTYGARSRLSQPSQPGSVAIYSYTATATTIEAIDMALGLLEKLHAVGIGEDMVDSGRNYILGQFPDTLETGSQLADTFAQLEFYGLDAGYIDDYGKQLAAVNPESLATTIAEVYPPVDDLVFVLLGDAEQIREAIQKYGPVTETTITEPRFKVDY